jgi:hypothetical protein|tara:strand:+ start:377 stop:481 length:105 start_codon:yes stop_codon:yes gene_type:complete
MLCKRIDIPELPSGVYFLKIKSEEKNSIFRVLRE